MSESKRDKFKRLRDNRLPKVLHAMGLIENLAGSGYESTQAENEELVAALNKAVDSVAEAFGAMRQASPYTPPQTKLDVVEVEDDKVPHTFVADGGATALSEISWAYDASRRGDHKLATSRLKRILDAVEQKS